jgi:hypothetical protein
MNHRLLWIGILVVLALTLVSVANCRQVPDPWEPKAGSSEPQPAR